jgi:ribosomal protein S18 acetylase RimI-like enzyme
VPRVAVPATIRLRSVRTPAELASVRRLLEEYGRSLRVDLGFEGFPEELRSLPGAYARPHGNLLLATVDGVPAGCVGVRAFSQDIGEMKRLFVRPRFRRRGIGRTLTLRALRSARRLGFRSLRLDTLAEMTRAAALYCALGFKEIPPYRDNPFSGTRYFECDLTVGKHVRSPSRGTNK